MKYVISLFLLGGVLLGCENQDPEIKKLEKAAEYDGPVTKNDYLNRWLSANPQILNPILSTDAYASEVFPYVFDRLIFFDAEEGEPKGRLAKSWEISDDGLTYTFKLRENVTFHDGEPLTAEDVKFTFDTIKNPEVDAAHLQNYYESLESTEIVDKHTIRLHMSEVYFRNLIIVGLADIIPKHIYGEGDFNEHPNNREPVGSGPYEFVRWDTGRLIELKRVENHWSQDTEYFGDRFNFEKIMFRIITEDSVAAMATKRGDIDLMEPTPIQFLNDFGNEKIEERFYRLNYSTQDGNGYRYIGWNLDDSRFKSKKIRRALAKALPRKKINDELYEGLMGLSVGHIPADSPKTDPELEPIAYDLEGAEKLFAEKGWTKNESGELVNEEGEQYRFELMFTADSPENERIALVFQRSLDKLGIKMDIRTLEWTVFIDNVRGQRFDAVLLAWGSSLDGDPYQIWHSSQGGGGSNFVNFQNERVDEILEEARRTLDREERNRLYHEFTRIIAEEAPYLFIFERPHLNIIHRRIQKVLPVGEIGLDETRWFVPPGFEKHGTQQPEEAAAY